jgi:carotenoid cleavage dioxygenase-like enzyme
MMPEEISPSILQTQGVIPAYLSGVLVRNGPVNVTLDGKSNAHWFDGLAMLHAFAFDQGSITYYSKYLRTDAFRCVTQKKTLNYVGFAQDPCRSLFQRIASWFIPHIEIPNANINVAYLADAYAAFFEIPMPVRFDQHTLETLGLLDFPDALPKQNVWESAHPIYDAQEDETINYLVEYGRQSYYTFYRLRKKSKSREVLAKIPVKEPAYMHSFSVTENYCLLTEYPFVVKPFDLWIKNVPFIHNFFWDPSRGTQFLVIDRKEGKLIGNLRTDPFFAFHHVNAFEEGGRIHCDLLSYDDPRIIGILANHFRRESGHPENEVKIRLMRYSLSLNNGLIQKRELWDKPAELPRINDLKRGVAYRFAYLADPREPDEAEEDIRPIYKWNTELEQAEAWSERGCFPGEAVFIPAPNARQEDEGVVLSVVLDLKSQRSFLLILDAKNFKELGRAYAPQKIPVGLHGQFFGRKTHASS